jgi:formylglycine-generating enzyme required for sulfatase activity
MAPVLMRQVRIFVSSPGDCAQERALLDEAVERINKSEMDRSGILLRTFKWEDDVVPRIGPPPGGVIDEQTPFCDIYVGIMSARFGGDGTRESGTEQEFRDALTRFGHSGRPWILFYFNEQPQTPQTVDAGMDLVRVLTFRKELETEGIVGTYAGARGSANGFFETIELHLRTLLQRPEFQAPASDLAAARTAAQGTPAKPVIPPQYLVWLQSKCAGVDLFGLEPKYGSAARLQSVYVPLITTPSTGPAANPTRREAELNERDPFRPTLLLDRFANESLYVSGPPGSGKSTFCRWVTLLACAGQMPVTNLADAPKRYREAWPTAFGGRLPVLVRLREYWQAFPARPGSRELSRQEFERCFATWVVSNSDGLDDAEHVLTHLAAGSALVVLDGVDEVPLVHDEGRAQWFPRALLLSGLANTMTAWTAAGNRALVTSRPYGVATGAVQALGLREVPLRELDAHLQRLLVDRWFQQLRPGEEGTRYAKDLIAHLREHPWLARLSVNPLLLTGMCIVFDEGGRLPQDTHELYLRIVNTVLNSRYRDDVEGRERARYRLQAIAYGMHTGRGLGEYRLTPQAEVSYSDLDRILREYLDKSASKEEGNTTTVAVREELLSQSGLFLGRGDNTAGFYHFSFQEFLAGQRLADVENDLLPVFCERADIPEWHSTLSLLFVSLTREKAARLVTRLVEAFDASGPRVQQVAADCLDILLARGVRLDAPLEQTCRDAFSRTMVSGAPAVVRFRVGNTLGRLGDPRFHDERLWCLPKDPMLGLVEVPAGSFIMGADEAADPDWSEDDRPAHRVSLPTYLIGRYPVTVAQFSAFVTNVNLEVFAPQSVRGVPNHAVKYVRWDDALAYCRWLDSLFRASSALPETLKSWLDRTNGWRVTLPSEAEWERAARGQAGRRYPWGEQELATKSDDLWLVSSFEVRPVGVAPNYATPESEGRVEELIGNVEWTRSRWAQYPYDRNDGRERLDLYDSDRVLRGHTRITMRDKMLPANIASSLVGFRVAVSCLPS